MFGVISILTDDTGAYCGVCVDDSEVLTPRVWCSGDLEQDWKLASTFADDYYFVVSVDASVADYLNKNPTFTWAYAANADQCSPPVITRV